MNNASLKTVALVQHVNQNNEDNSSSSTKRDRQKKKSIGHNKEKNVCVHRHMKMVKKELSISRRKITYEKHVELKRRLTGNKKNKKSRQNPVSLFPEEVWKMIFERVTDGVDLLNCSKTCTLFANMLKDSRKEFLFDTVLPFLTGKLDQMDILRCRLVSKTWCSNVDKCLKNVNLFKEDAPIGQPVTITPKRAVIPTYPYKFCALPTKRLDCFYKIYVRKEGEMNSMRSHPRNPFIGGYFCYHLCSPITLEKPEIDQKARTTLTEFASYLVHVKIESGLVSNAPSINLICHALKVCKNMRSFIVIVGNDDEQYAPDPSSDVITDVEIPWCQNLESLSIRTGMYWLSGFPIENALIRKYSSQLKFLSIDYWSRRMYHKFSWQELTGLNVRKAVSLAFLESVCKLEAPRLQQLHLYLNDSSVPLFRKLMRALNGFPALTTITLKISYAFEEFNANKIFKNEQNSELIYSKTITCINLNFDTIVPSTFSFDFLTFFPFLKQLGIQALIWEKAADCFSSDCIQLKPYIYECLECSNANPLYKSNVWEVLPGLEVVELFISNAKRWVHVRGRYEISWEAVYAERSYLHRFKPKGLSKIMRRL